MVCVAVNGCQAKNRASSDHDIAICWSVGKCNFVLVCSEQAM